MTRPIRPQTLKALRERRKMTQAGLAARCVHIGQKVSVATIKRIEASGQEAYLARRTVAERLAKALRVGAEDLAKPPQPEDIDRFEALRRLGLRELRRTVRESTALSFRMVKHLYGIPISAQVEMAPLFMALLAEGSLAWRAERVAEIKTKSEELISLGVHGHLSFTIAAYSVHDGSEAEEESIKKKDLFGEDDFEEAHDFGYDRSTNNPFADYIRKLARDLGDVPITVDPDDNDWTDSNGFPEYRIGNDLIEELTSGNKDAVYALACNHAKIREIPEDLLGEEQAERRVEWLISLIPAEELSARRAWRAEKNAKIDEIKKEIPFPVAVSRKPKGNAHIKGGNRDA